LQQVAVATESHAQLVHADGGDVAVALQLLLEPEAGSLGVEAKV
jgi:hypothetical protein